jgi:flagellar biosynthesis protein FlhB
MPPVAESAGVPVVEDESLAAALVKRCRAGAEVPRSLYERVAEVLAFAREVAREAQGRTDVGWNHDD